MSFDEVFKTQEPPKDKRRIIIEPFLPLFYALVGIGFAYWFFSETRTFSTWEQFADWFQSHPIFFLFVITTVILWSATNVRKKRNNLL